MDNKGYFLLKFRYIYSERERKYVYEDKCARGTCVGCHMCPETELRLSGLSSGTLSYWPISQILIALFYERCHTSLTFHIIFKISWVPQATNTLLFERALVHARSKSSNVVFLWYLLIILKDLLNTVVWFPNLDLILK